MFNVIVRKDDMWNNFRLEDEVLKILFLPVTHKSFNTKCNYNSQW